jgi:uncharacterized sulfatase
MDRRSFLKGAAAIPIGGMVEGLAPQANAATTAQKPNILFILVDEMRFPSAFPAGINSPAEFLARFMPNTYRLWQSGVKFANHFNAANACTPSRGVLISGLYSHQSWLTQTIKALPYTNVSVAPVLNRLLPTYGKLLQQAGYRTPYIGKWHASIPGPSQDRLSLYGFEGLTYYDPTGANLQGAVGDVANGYLSDADIASQAGDWISRYSRGTPWCLTVSFINPHDHEFFWAGTEFDRYNPLFEGSGREPFFYYSSYKGVTYPPVVDPQANPFRSPPSYGYPVVPPNWETTTSLAGKPAAQMFARTFQGTVWGAVSEHPGQHWYSVSPYPNPSQSPTLASLGIGVAPFSYWQRGLDCYTQAMTLVDRHVGTLLDSLPAEVARNTVIVFTSDHGDYAGAHGLLAGKVGTVYDEAFQVPLIVNCPAGVFAGDTDTIRTELTSSVDVMGMLVSMGYNGTRDWITPELMLPYATRHDMMPMLRSAAAPGRPYVLLAGDEQAPDVYNYNDAAMHIVGVRTKEAKLGLYANWVNRSVAIDPASIETEYYDYRTSRGRLELDNTPNSDEAQAMKSWLLNTLIPNELRAPIAPSLQTAQQYSKIAYLAYIEAVNRMTRDDIPS